MKAGFSSFCVSIAGVPQSASSLFQWSGVDKDPDLLHRHKKGAFGFQSAFKRWSLFIFEFVNFFVKMSFTKAFTYMAPKTTDQEMIACMHVKCIPHHPSSFMWWLEGKYVPGFLPFSNGSFLSWFMEKHYFDNKIGGIS